MQEARRHWLGFVGMGAASAATGLSVSGCASTTSMLSPPSNAKQKPQVAVGDTWEYAEINRYNRIQQAVVTHRVTNVTPIIRIARTAKVGNEMSERTEEIYDSLWTVRQEPHYEVPIVFDQPLPLLPSSLEPGAREVIQTAYKFNTIDKLFYWRAHSFVAGWEKVVVPAGEFTALRIERTFWFAHPDSFRFDNVRRDVMWYSPLVSRWVRRDWTGEYRSPSSRRIPLREDWVRWDLLSYKKA